MQKFYASSRFRDRTAADGEAATARLGHYCDLQSLNSEDAVTWTFFGNLAYSPPSQRRDVLNRLLARIGLSPDPEEPLCWLWRRVPHPEKPDSNGGPEIDFGFQTSNTLVLGEAKWNSTLGKGQGIAGNRTQLYLRAKYCDELARRALPSVTRHIVLGVGRTANVFIGTDLEISTGATVAQISWADVADAFPPDVARELRQYLAWKDRYSTAATSRETSNVD